MSACICMFKLECQNGTLVNNATYKGQSIMWSWSCRPLVGTYSHTPNISLVPRPPSRTQNRWLCLIKRLCMCEIRELWGNRRLWESRNWWLHWHTLYTIMTIMLIYLSHICFLNGMAAASSFELKSWLHNSYLPADLPQGSLYIKGREKKACMGTRLH